MSLRSTCLPTEGSGQGRNSSPPDREANPTGGNSNPASLLGIGTKLWIYNITGDESPPFLTDAWLVPLLFALIMLVGLVTVQATCITLTAISVDRCYATLYPLQSLRRRSPRVATAVSVGIWIGSFILSLPMALYHHTEVGFWYGLRTYCMEKFPTPSQQKSYILYTFLAVYLLPLLTICICYTIMLKRVGRPVVEPIDNNYQQVQPLSERSVAMRAKVTRMVVVIVLLFGICWGPIQLFLLCQGFYPGFQANYETYKIKTWANCMSYANSSLNPIVYAFMGESFRKSFKKAFPFMFRHRVQDTTLASGSRNNVGLKSITEGS
ncbi:GPR54 protein, partial [Polypterus senegalus]